MPETENVGAKGAAVKTKKNKAEHQKQDEKTVQL